VACASCELCKASAEAGWSQSWSTSGRVKWAVPSTMSRSVNLRSDLWAAALPVGSAGLPWLSGEGPSRALLRDGKGAGGVDWLRGVSVDGGRPRL
jgi:hypothetical protein